MKINADFSKRIAMRFAAMDWTPSPMPGVDRKMLDRIGGEVARATTIVRYAPGSAFSAHTHEGGEEFLVLDGVFSDEHGDFPKGSYIRNPPTSRHTPGSEPGCVILVKLHQFQAEDRTHVRMASGKMGAVAPSGRPGVAVTPLYADQWEEVRIENWAPNAKTSFSNDKGAEVFLLEGSFSENGDEFGRWDWLRLPPGRRFEGVAGDAGARVWIKTGHLAELATSDQH